MPVTLAIWESLEQLRQQFPCALAWGQAASEEGESVSHAEEASQEQTQFGPARPRRQARLSKCVSGPKWVQYMYL